MRRTKKQWGQPPIDLEALGATAQEASAHESGRLVDFTKAEALAATGELAVAAGMLEAHT